MSGIDPRLSLAAVLLGSVLLTACGGGSQDPTPAEPNPDTGEPAEPNQPSRISRLNYDMDGNGKTDIIADIRYDAQGRVIRLHYSKVDDGVTDITPATLAFPAPFPYTMGAGDNGSLTVGITYNSQGQTETISLDVIESGERRRIIETYAWDSSDPELLEQLVADYYNLETGAVAERKVLDVYYNENRKVDNWNLNWYQYHSNLVYTTTATVTYEGNYPVLYRSDANGQINKAAFQWQSGRIAQADLSSWTGLSGSYFYSYHDDGRLAQYVSSDDIAQSMSISYDTNGRATQWVRTITNYRMDVTNVWENGPCKPLLLWHGGEGWDVFNSNPDSPWLGELVLREVNFCKDFGYSR